MLLKHLMIKSILLYKKLKNYRGYLTEKAAILKIRETVPDIDEIGIMASIFDDENLKIKAKVCLCNLKDYCENVEKGVKKLTSQNIKYIFKFLVFCVIKLKKYGLSHRDIKPDNIMI